jgi:hypothetical protein
MRDIDARDLARYQGRRLFLLITPRGTGKGHLFDSLNDDDSLRNVALATWGRRAEPEGARVPAMPCYAGAALLSLSFSNEIVSVFDRLAAFLADCFPRVADREIARQREWEELQKNRIGCLRFAMNEYTKFKNDPENVRRGTNRLLVVINGINKMFDRNGIAKNTQFFHLFESVVQEAYAAAPIDFVFISSDESIPRQFRSLSSTARIGTLAQPIR